MATVLDLSYTKALQFFMTPENYCTLSMPEYIDFGSVLEYVQKITGTKKLKMCLKERNRYPSKYDGVNYMMLINKDGKYAYRPIQLANPFLYYLLVKEMTSKYNWEEIKQRFKYFEDTHIEVSSIPVIKDEKDKTSTATTILNWWNNLEQRSIELSMNYKYMFMTDITNCYGSIYTHSITWAMSGKEIAKADIGKESLGNTIDTYMEGMQYGQTNGIPQGSVLFDLIAEIVLGYTDRLLADRLTTLKIEDYKILRYRDDYRIFSNSKEDIDKISLELQTVLADFNFHMNVSKTKLSESIVADAIKQDKFFYVSNIPAYNGNTSQFPALQKELYYVLYVAKKYPNSGTVCKLITLALRRIENEETINENIRVLIAIVLDITLTSPKIYQPALACISNLINRLENSEEKVELLKTVYNKLNTLPNIGHIQIWMQRLTWKYDQKSDVNPYTEPICRIVYGDIVNLWNNDWLKDEFTKDFPVDKICDEKKLNEMQAFIKAEEIDIFEY